MEQPRPNTTLDALCEYYIDVAYRLGFSPMRHKKNEAPKSLRDDDNWQAGYSLAWYFSDYFKHDLLDPAPEPDGTTTNLLGAFFGHGRLVTPDPRDYEQQWAHEQCLLADGFPADRNPLNEEQTEAVRKALHNPISLIKGPAGTGKTEVIMHIIAIALDEGQTVAMVSSNSLAVGNVVEKARKSLERHAKTAGKDTPRDLAYEAAIKLAPLGSSDTRKDARPLDPDAEPFSFTAEKGGWEKDYTFETFTHTMGYPFVTSTVHSLKKCFKDGASTKFDLLIMDEASQTSQLLGVVALSCAKRVVIVGDEKQLPPVIADVAFPSLNGLWDYWLLQPLSSLGEDEREKIRRTYDVSLKGASFLRSCYEVFDPEDTTELHMRQTATKTALIKHYRCPEPIIGFCNREVYGGELDVRTPTPTSLEGSAYDETFPMSLIWYEGDYRESFWVNIPKPKGDDGKSDKRWGRKLTGGELAFHSSSMNEKQLAIMRHEEIPRLKRLLEQDKDQNLSVCFLSPFKAQTKLVENLLRETLPPDVLENAKAMELDGEAEGKEEPPHSRNKVSAFTIHGSQGHEFDIVYLLPVEDGNWEWPWSQSRELINVAVSRAMRELRVVMSTKLMSDELQVKLCGRRTKVKEPAREMDDPEDEQLFVRKLATYMTERCPKGARRPFSVSETTLRSIFDDIPHVQVGRSAVQKDRDYAPQAIMRNALIPMVQERGLDLYEEVPLSEIRLDGVALDGKVSEDVPIRMHFDFVIARKDGRVVLLVEADGGFHRHATAKGEVDADDDATRSIDGFCHVTDDGQDDTDSQKRPERKLCDYHQALSDLHKNRVVTDVCGGRILHLGKDSSLGDRRDYYAWVSTQDVRHDAEEDAAPVDVTTPEELKRAGIVGTSLLRVPSDGSTFLETRRLRELMTDEPLPSELPPTIEDYLDVCEDNLSRNLERALSLDPRAMKGFLVPEEEPCARSMADGKSLAAVIKTLKENDRYRELLEGVDARRLQPKLLAAGLLAREENPDGKGRWRPTKEGEGIGIGLSEKNEKGETWPLYSKAAQEYLADHLEELLKG